MIDGVNAKSNRKNQLPTAIVWVEGLDKNSLFPIRVMFDSGSQVTSDFREHNRKSEG